MARWLALLLTCFAALARAGENNAASECLTASPLKASVGLSNSGTLLFCPGPGSIRVFVKPVRVPVPPGGCAASIATFPAYPGVLVFCNPLGIEFGKKFQLASGAMACSNSTPATMATMALNPATLDFEVCASAIYLQGPCPPTFCSGRGTCETSAGSDFSPYVCNCSVGYTGANCEQDVDECESYACQNSGVCTNTAGSFTCGCMAGFTGATCAINTNNCLKASCFGSQQCVDAIDKSVCVCATNMTGPSCVAANTGRNSTLLRFGSKQDDNPRGFYVASDTSFYAGGYADTTTALFVNRTSIVYSGDLSSGLSRKVLQLTSVLANVGLALAVDSRDGSVYLAGEAQGLLPWDIPGTTFYGGYDAFLLKMAPNGTVLWSRNLGSAGDDWAYSVAVDSAFNVVVTGLFGGPTTYDPTQAYYGQKDMFLAKYNPLGDRIWLRTLGSNESETSRSVVVDSFNNIVVGGSTNSTLGTSATVAARSASNGYLAKYTPQGDLMWLRVLWLDEVDAFYSAAIDLNNNVFTVGHVTTLGTRTALLVKYTSGGVLLWRKPFGSSLTVPRSIAAGPAGNLFVCGSDLSPGGINQMVAFQFDNDGNILWSFKDTEFQNSTCCGIVATATNTAYALSSTTAPLSLAQQLLASSLAGMDMIITKFT